MSDEHEFEPIRGLPEVPPEGERILWQGAPNWRGIARRVFHTRKIALYCGILLGWRGVSALYDGQSIEAAALAVLWLTPLALAAVGIFALIAWLIGRTTVYTITTKRVVMRFGIALPITLNVPFTVVEAAGLKTFADDSGDIPLTLNGGERIAYLILWPHVRPWRIKEPQPMLRSIPAAADVAEILARALTAPETVRTMHRAPAAETETSGAPPLVSALS